MGIVSSSLSQRFFSPLLARLLNKITATVTNTTNNNMLDPNLPKPPPYLPPAATDKDILELPLEEDLFGRLVALEDAPLRDFDPGVLSEELLNLRIFPQVNRGASAGGPDGATYAGGNIEEGTYAGTQAALTQIYAKIERSYGSYLDVLGIEPTLPRHVPLEEKKTLYQFSPYPHQSEEDPTSQPAPYPPHLQTIPKPDDVPRWQIFNALGLLESGVILQKVVPDTFLGKTADWLLTKARAAVSGGNPQAGVTLRDVEAYNRLHRKSGTDIARGYNVGMLPDWFGDRRFAEQAFTGTNPTTITRVPAALLGEFVDAARGDGYDAWAEVLPAVDPASLFVQDCRYFREAIGAEPEATLHDKQRASDDNWACAAVTLFRLHDDGKLHPVAITIDYKGTMADSVTIFNKRMSPSDSSVDEATDWPWRYAKTCAQVSDWLRHELAVHLTNAHFIEEAIIVATNRTIPMDHIIYKILQPHWYKTLSLNAAARDTLVPQVVRDIVGLSPEQSSSFIRHAYETFDFVGNYVPNQLASRGFPSDAASLADPRYKNYAYAKNMTLMWSVIRKYVHAILLTHYDTTTADHTIANDAHIAAWCTETQTAAHIPSFPKITTLDALTDVLTMCIHTAAPFHSTVNYLQNFYQAFVPAKPSCLCAPPPATLAQLTRYTEADLVAALPLGRQRQWLLASQIPWLLSFRVGEDRSLVNFALSQWSVYRRKGSKSESGSGSEAGREDGVREASAAFYGDLCGLARAFYANSKGMDEGAIPYLVSDPSVTAVSILI